MGAYFRIPEPLLEPPEPKAVGTCKRCGQEIYVGDEIVELSGDFYHEECFSDCAASILLSEFGAMACVAEDGGMYG